MIPQKDRIESAIRHIQTATDVDPWAMELAVEALKAQSDEYNNYLAGLMDGELAIKALPSAQPERCEDCANFGKTRLLIPQPEIIRCRDCKYYDEVNQPYPQMYCRKHSIDTSDQDFCSRAERRADESD